MRRTSEEGTGGYVVFNREGERVGGLMVTPASVPAEVPSYWLVYFEVVDATSSCARLAEQGGVVLEPAHDIEEGRLAGPRGPRGRGFRGVREPHGLILEMIARGSLRGVLPTALILAMMLGACGGDGGTAVRPGSIVGRTFLSKSVTEDDAVRPLVERTRIRLTFHEDGRIAAYAGCNNLGGSVEVERDRIVVGELLTTEIGCEPALHDQDEWLAEVLVADLTYTLDGDRLRLSSHRTTIELIDRRVADPDRPLEGAQRAGRSRAGSVTATRASSSWAIVET